MVFVRQEAPLRLEGGEEEEEVEGELRLFFSLTQLIQRQKETLI